MPTPGAVSGRERLAFCRSLVVILLCPGNPLLQARGSTHSVRLSGAMTKSQVWNSVVSVTLVEAREVCSDPPGGQLFVCFKLGEQMYKSKVSRVLLSSNAIWVTLHLECAAPESAPGVQTSVEGEVHAQPPPGRRSRAGGGAVAEGSTQERGVSGEVRLLAPGCRALDADAACVRADARWTCPRFPSARGGSSAWPWTRAEESWSSCWRPRRAAACPSRTWAPRRWTGPAPGSGSWRTT